MSHALPRSTPFRPAIEPRRLLSSAKFRLQGLFRSANRRSRGSAQRPSEGAGTDSFTPLATGSLPVLGAEDLARLSALSSSATHIFPGNDVIVVVVGCGRVGLEIAGELARRGCIVRLCDSSPANVEQAMVRHTAKVKHLTEHRLLLEGAGAPLLERCKVAGSIEEAVVGASVVIEATPDRLALKRSLLAALASACERANTPPEGVLLCTNSATLELRQMTTALEADARLAPYAERVVGLRFLLPVWFVDEVVVSSRQTSTRGAQANNNASRRSVPPLSPAHAAALASLSELLALLRMRDRKITEDPSGLSRDEALLYTLRQHAATGHARQQASSIAQLHLFKGVAGSAIHASQMVSDVVQQIAERNGLEPLQKTDQEFASAQALVAEIQRALTDAIESCTLKNIFSELQAARYTTCAIRTSMRKMLADSLPAGRSQMRLAYLPPAAAAAAAFADSDGVQLALGVGTSACSPLSPDEPERAPSATAADDLEVAVDNIMLKLAINEILLNASAYSQHQATISCAAIYFDQSPLPPSYIASAADATASSSSGVSTASVAASSSAGSSTAVWPASAKGHLRVVIESQNKPGKPLLTEDECTQIFRRGFRGGNTLDAMEDAGAGAGFGLSTTAAAVKAGGGHVWASTRAAADGRVFTAITICLPADLLAHPVPAREGHRPIQRPLACAPATPYTPADWPTQDGAFGRSAALRASGSEPTLDRGSTSTYPNGSRCHGAAIQLSEVAALAGMTAAMDCHGSCLDQALDQAILNSPVRYPSLPLSR